MREPAWCESLRWELHSVSDWFSERRMWRTANAMDRIALTIYRLFNRRQGQRPPRPSPPSPLPPICADTGEPKWPGNCWNVRCQLGGTCCRADGVQVAPAPDCWACNGTGRVTTSSNGEYIPDAPCAACTDGVPGTEKGGA